MMFLAELLVSCLLLYDLIAASVIERASSPTVSIAPGIVIGTATTVYGSPTATVHAYLGIPFAQSPPQRFSPPIPPTPWLKPLVAQSFSPICIQQFVAGMPGSPTQAKTKAYFNNPSGPTPIESEDCLYLNVYTPEASGTNASKAVMFWIFAGDLRFGGGSFTYYNGSRLAYENDVVVVTFNYRTNIFGFSNSPQIPFGQQNAGYLDTRLALSWVQQNIGSFGGDPNKVTIFGTSSGGYIVKQLLANPPKPLPFKSAIMQSEAISALSNSQGSGAWQTTVMAFGCAFAYSQIDCMRAVPALSLKQFIEANTITFSPVDGDGTQSYDIRPEVQNGISAVVPILIGTNADEARIFMDIAGLNNNNNTNNYNNNPWTFPTFPALGSLLGDNSLGLLQQVFNLAPGTYPPSISQNPHLLTSQIATDVAYTCPTARLSEFLASHGYPVWRYLYSADFLDVRYFPNAGAYHSSEVTTVFGTYPAVGPAGSATATQVELSRLMRAVWTGFAKGQRPIWPAIGTYNGLELANFGANNSSAARLQTLASEDYPYSNYQVFDMAND